jgi:hypothetical protein
VRAVCQKIIGRPPLRRASGWVNTICERFSRGRSRTRSIALLDNEHVQPGWLLELVTRLQVRYPSLPIVFADSRKLAEDWTHRFLAAALVQHAPQAEAPQDA